MSQFRFIGRERNHPVNQMRVPAMWIIEADNFPYIQCGHQRQVLGLERDKSNVEFIRYQRRDLTQLHISSWLGYHMTDTFDLFYECKVFFPDEQRYIRLRIAPQTAATKGRVMIMSPRKVEATIS